MPPLTPNVPELREFRFLKPVMIRQIRTVIADSHDFYPLYIRYLHRDFVPVPEQTLELSGKRRCALNFANKAEPSRRLYIYKHPEDSEGGFVLKTEALSQSPPADLHVSMLHH